MSSEAEYQPIPVAAARQICEAHGKSIAVIIAYDPVHECTHTTTYGVAAVEKENAAAMGELCTQAIGGDLSRKQVFEDYHQTYEPAVLAECLELLRRAVARQGMTLADVAQAERVLKSIGLAPRSGG